VKKAVVTALAVSISLLSYLFLTLAMGLLTTSDVIYKYFSKEK
jgi:hypothetical protein